MRPFRRVRPRSATLATFGSVFVAALVLAPGAFASTLSYASGTLTYTPASTDTRGVDVSFNGPAGGPIEVNPSDDDVITGTVPGNCSASTSGYPYYTCTGVSSVVANGTPLEDHLDVVGVGDIPVTLNGGDGNDGLAAGTGPATLNGGNGDDTLAAGTGPATMNGGNGNDTMDPGNATDTVSGGPGVDQVTYFDNGLGSGPGWAAAAPVNVSLDNLANDGYAGNNSNIESDVEDVTVQDALDCSGDVTCGYGGATLTGDSAPNALSGGSGDDTITGGGGGDFLSGNGGNNTLNGVNGYPDRLACGGTGTANADQLDTVVDCTTVNQATLSGVGLLTQDRAPTLSWSSPKQNARINPSKRSRFRVTATAGTHPIAQVAYYVGERTACIAKTAPYTCVYRAKESDVGKHTLLAIATDSIGLTTTRMRTITITRFKPKKLTASSKPKTDKHAPYVFTTSGRLTLPSGVTKRTGCTGKVSVTIRSGKKKVGGGTAKLRSNCTYRSRVKVVVAKGHKPAKTLRVSVAFGGNSLLRKASAKGYKVHTS